MMYQLNNDYDLGQGETLVNPRWKLAPVLDDCEHKKVTINVILETNRSLNHHRHLTILDYSENGTWEDSDLYNCILSQPGFEDSTLIEEE